MDFSKLWTLQKKAHPIPGTAICLAEKPNAAPGTTDVPSCLSVLGPLLSMKGVSGRVREDLQLPFSSLKSLCGLRSVLSRKGMGAAKP